MDTADQINADGMWWLPAFPENLVPGRLTYGGGNEPFLELQGGLPHDDLQLQTIHGQLGSEKVSLHRASVNSLIHGMSGVTRMGLFADRVVIGAHLSEDASIDQIRVRYSAINDWAQAHSFRTYQIEGGWQTTMLTPPPIEERVSDPVAGLIRLQMQPGATNLAANETRTAGLSQTAWLEMQPDDPISIDEALRLFVMPCRSILSVCLSQKCEILQISIASPEGSHFPVEIWTSEVVGEARDVRVSSNLIPFTAITFGPKEIARWLADAPSLSALLAASIEVWHKVGYAETRMMQVAAAAEGLHRGLYPSASRLPADIIKAVKSAAYGAVTTTEEKQIVAQALAQLGDYSFRMRLNTLFALVADGMPFTLCEPWTAAVARLRNKFAHALVDQSDSDVVLTDAYAAAVENTRSLEVLAQSVALCIYLVVANRCGIEPGEAGQAFKRSYEMRLLGPALDELFPDFNPT